MRYILTLFLAITMVIPLTAQNNEPKQEERTEGHKEEFYVPENPLAPVYIEAQKAMAAAMQK